MRSRRWRVLLTALLLPVAWLATADGARADHVAPVASDTNMANLAANERELFIVGDPNDRDHLAAGANERGGGNTQEWYVSTDGGRNWTSGNLPTGTLTVAGTTSTLMSDPALDFDNDGDIYYSALQHGGSGEPCTLFVSVSADDGANWTDPANGIVATGTTGPSVCHDKEFILVDRANSNNVYVAWTPFGDANDREVVFSRDLGGVDNGFAFSAPTVLSTDAAQDGCLNHGAELAQASAGGALYVAWVTLCSGFADGDDGTIWVARSNDQGANWGAPVQVATLDNVTPAIATGFRSRSFPSIDVDPATGRVHVVWADYVDTDGGNADILMSTSADGATWSGATTVNSDAVGDDQFMPWVSVANGKIHVAYYGHDGGTSSHDAYLAYADTGTTAFTEVRVSSVSTPQATGFLGDYLGVWAGPDDVAHVSWGDGRPGVGGSTDAFHGRVDFSPPTTVSASTSPSALPWGGTTTVTASVTGAHSEDEEHIPVTFTVTGTGSPSPSTGTDTTDASGDATFSYSNATAGTDTVNVWADFDGDGTQDAGETTSTTVTWQAHPTTATYTGPTSGEYHDPLTVSGTLEDALTGTPLSGKTLTIGFGTDTCDGTTDATGSASCTFTPEQVPGPYTATARFAGDSQYAPDTSDAVAFTLNKEQTTLTLGTAEFLANGDPAVLRATLTEDDPTPVAGRTVALTVGSGAGAQSCTGVTNASGVASCTVAVLNQPLGPVPLAASFAGDAYYLPSNATGQVIVFAWTPGGNFVIGDGNDTTGATATFWADDWYLRNTVSGGQAPSSFKGFANDPPGKTTCGGTWTTKGGNSPPPTKLLPQYTAMLVTSLARKSGSVITGTKPAIAIVRVNPGYSPSPGKRGTAQVLGLFCG